MGYAAVVIEVIAAVAGAYAAKQQGDFQRAVAKRNADLQTQAARDAQARGLAEGTRVALAGGYVLGAKRAALGASGVTVNSGSPLESIADQALFTKLDVETTRSNATREAFGYEAGAINSRIGGNYARKSGTLNATSTLLTGAVGAYGDYYRISTAGTR
jgi:hypothetical protein